LNVKTERLDDHTARLTVEIESERWQAAKERAARKLSKRYRIPGFRKGKAPYGVIVRYVGEPSIVEDAIELLGNEVYRDALDASEVKPYTSGSLEDFQLEPPTYVFNVPLQPEIDLVDYRETRIDYVAPEVTDEQVDQSLDELRQQHALVEESEGPISLGDRVTIDIHSEFADGEESDTTEDDQAVADEAPDAEGSEDTEAEDRTGEQDDDDQSPRKGDSFFHRHDWQVTLQSGEKDPLLPGFSAALIDSNVGDTVEFELDVPEGESYKGIEGRKIHCSVDIKKVEKVTLPELNDEFAARVTEGEDESLTLLQLRMRVRENLEKAAQQEADNAYANRVLDAIVEQVDVSYPPVMVDERIQDMIRDLEGELQRQGIQLDMYLRVMGLTQEDLRERYEESAEKSVVRSLVLGELIVKERISVPVERIDERIQEMIGQFGDQAEIFREFLNTPQQRDSMANQLLYEGVMERLKFIGQGTAPELSAEQPEEVAGVEETAAGVSPETVSETTSKEDSIPENASDDENDSTSSSSEDESEEDSTSSEEDKS